jgi:hypothetical protein
MTLGGEGSVGSKLSPDAIERRKCAMRGKPPLQMLTLEVALKKQRRVDPTNPDASRKRCRYCDVEFDPKPPLTPSSLRAHVKRIFCSRRCAIVYHNMQAAGTHRSDDVKQKISHALTGNRRVPIEIDASHSDATPKKCAQCDTEFLPKHPLTPCRIKAHKQKRFCSRRCALEFHNDQQRSVDTIKRG